MEILLVKNQPLVPPCNVVYHSFAWFDFQLYVDGNLIGGLDIVKEMKESGELEELVKSKSGPSSNGTSSLNER